MKHMYIDCSMGAAGDMLTAALLELMPDRDKTVDKLNKMGIPGIKYESFDIDKSGVSGTRVRVTYKGEEEVTEDVHSDHHHDEHEHDHDHDHQHGHSHDHSHEHERGHEHEHHHHHHNRLSDIENIVQNLNLSETVKQDVMAVYQIIAEAESIAHNEPVDQVHFHEVGSMDAVADAAAACYLMNQIKPDAVSVSDIHVGTGHVMCAHGLMPVPAPATENILAGLPTYGGEVEGELCTPTGAAILKYFGTEFGGRFGELSSNAENLAAEDGGNFREELSVGRGMGSKDFERPNCVTIILTNDE